MYRSRIRWFTYIQSNYGLHELTVFVPQIFNIGALVLDVYILQFWSIWLLIKTESLHELSICIKIIRNALEIFKNVMHCMNASFTYLIAYLSHGVVNAGRCIVEKRTVYIQCMQVEVHLKICHAWRGRGDQMGCDSVTEARGSSAICDVTYAFVKNYYKSKECLSYLLVSDIMPTDSNTVGRWLLWLKLFFYCQLLCVDWKIMFEMIMLMNRCIYALYSIYV